jgi:hypothetical protein
VISLRLRTCCRPSMLQPRGIHPLCSPPLPYAGVVEQGKILLIPLIFALRTGKEIKVGETLSGTVCLRLKVADSDGRSYTVGRPLIAVTIDVADASGSSNRWMIQTRLLPESYQQENPTDLYDRVHFRPWF